MKPEEMQRMLCIFAVPALLAAFLAGGWNAAAGADPAPALPPEKTVARVRKYTLEFSTFFGGAGGTCIRGMDVDKDGNIYVAGGTGAKDFPTTPGVIQEKYNPRGHRGPLVRFEVQPGREIGLVNAAVGGRKQHAFQCEGGQRRFCVRRRPRRARPVHAGVVPAQVPGSQRRPDDAECMGGQDQAGRFRHWFGPVTWATVFTAATWTWMTKATST